MNTRAELSIGEALVGLLENYGVEMIFGIPGVHNIEMYRALPRSKIRHILSRHEQGAGFMADGYARATGKPGVCFTISGPGVTNILTPIGQAWSDSSNILVVSTALDVASSAQGRGRLHEMISQIDAAKSVTAYAARAYTAQDVQNAIAAAFARFATLRPRPAYLEVPLDILSKPAGDGWNAVALPKRALASADQIAAAVAKLNAAKKPCLILGGGAQRAGHFTLQIAEKLNAPILHTVAGKGSVSSDHPLVWGACLANEFARDFIKSSDCILAVGTELSETDFWALDFAITEHLIRVDIDPDALARPHRAEIAIWADAAPTLLAMAQGVEARQNSPRLQPQNPPNELRQMLAKILTTIRDALPPETVVVSDMTQIAYAANEIFPMHHPRTWLHPSGFGTLGFALPTAIGAKFGVGETPVAVLVGDYGFQYTLNELGTAVEHKLPLVILLWNNNALGQIRDNMVDAGIQPNAVTLLNPDFQMLAKAYGAFSEKPESLKALATAIKTALKANGPTVIEMTPRMLD